ncbi:hypothetical protein LEP1GSC043_2672 [Leptospira weilii str. Ecochallenge]|uniref:Uncharacterized protein n=1 Tax=Leptospira weilii str. Ecochallenge TaxID=1049986 RepID=N1UEE4_9LEPT|nr:hypothetical protein LEP1GSC043_2672 [Leptospira weilii str. Ecochallenge]
MLSKNKIIDNLKNSTYSFLFFEIGKNFVKVLLERNSFTFIFLVKLARWRAHKLLT